MPIYEYKCSACGHQLEALQKISDPPLAECPECGKAALQKLISSSAFQLKGTGWYVTDFRDRDKKKSTSQDGKQEDKAEAKGDETKANGAKESPEKTSGEKAPTKKTADK